MKHDPFDLLSSDLTPMARLWRAALKSGLIQVAGVDACLRAHSALAVAAK